MNTIHTIFCGTVIALVSCIQSLSAAIVVNSDYTQPASGGMTSTMEMAPAGSVSNTHLLHGLTGTFSNWNLASTFSPSNLNDGAYGGTSVPSRTSNAIARENGNNSDATFDFLAPATTVWVTTSRRSPRLPVGSTSALSSRPTRWKSAMSATRVGVHWSPWRLMQATPPVPTAVDPQW